MIETIIGTVSVALLVNAFYLLFRSVVSSYLNRTPSLKFTIKGSDGKIIEINAKNIDAKALQDLLSKINEETNDVQ
ncbi:MAG: hypothetical protein QX189_10940 [Methylococcales bacterium]